MNTSLELFVVLIIVVLAAVGLTLIMRNRKTVKLRQRFGPEYERTVEESGGRGHAEAQLHDREKRVDAFAVQPLSAGDKERFGVSWRRVQEEFVDDPARAVTHADELLGDVMSTIRWWCGTIGPHMTSR